MKTAGQPVRGRPGGEGVPIRRRYFNSTFQYAKSRNCFQLA